MSSSLERREADSVSALGDGFLREEREDRKVSKRGFGGNT